MEDKDFDLNDRLLAFGYTDLKTINGKTCGLCRFLFTTGLMVGLNEVGYECRYCFERHKDALAALSEWDGTGHPSGPWIKIKGVLDGDIVLVSPTGRRERLCWTN
jgi:hypothetical protein